MRFNWSQSIHVFWDDLTDVESLNQSFNNCFDTFM